MPLESHSLFCTNRDVCLCIPKDICNNGQSSFILLWLFFDPGLCGSTSCPSGLGLRGGCVRVNQVLGSPLRQSPNFFLSFFFFFLPFLGPLPRHKEVPRLGVESELWLLAYTTATAMRELSRICHLHHSSRQCRLLNALSKARDRTCNLMVSSQIR